MKFLFHKESFSGATENQSMTWSSATFSSFSLFYIYQDLKPLEVFFQKKIRHWALRNCDGLICIFSGHFSVTIQVKAGQKKDDNTELNLKKKLN